MEKDVIMVNNFFNRFLDELEMEISSKDFLNLLKKAQDIDSNYYQKTISINNLKNIIQGYRDLKYLDNENKTVLILLPGNPEIVFKLGIEAIRNNADFVIGIEDFCVGQNKILIEIINKKVQDLRLKNKIELKNLINDMEIIDVSKNVNKTIIIGNSNLYNRLKKQINVDLNPYGIFELYSDSEDFGELQEIIYKYLTQNQFESEFFDDLDFEEAIKIINKQGYKFCTILFTNDKTKIKKFKENVDSKYVVVNRNPFKEIKFKLEL